MTAYYIVTRERLEFAHSSKLHLHLLQRFFQHASLLHPLKGGSLQFLLCPVPLQRHKNRHSRATRLPSGAETTAPAAAPPAARLPPPPFVSCLSMASNASCLRAGVAGGGDGWQAQTFVGGAEIGGGGEMWGWWEWRKACGCRNRLLSC